MGKTKPWYLEMHITLIKLFLKYQEVITAKVKTVREVIIRRDLGDKWQKLYFFDHSCDDNEVYHTIIHKAKYLFFVLFIF